MLIYYYYIYIFSIIITLRLFDVNVNDVVVRRVTLVTVTLGMDGTDQSQGLRQFKAA